MIYILKHPNPNFKGYFGGVGFENGIGSTSVMSDYQKLLKIGYWKGTGKQRKFVAHFTDITEEYHEKKKKEGAGTSAKSKEKAEEKKE